jgi:hypothetical protein
MRERKYKIPYFVVLLEKKDKPEGTRSRDRCQKNVSNTLDRSRHK